MNIVLMHGILGFGAVIPPIPDYFHGVADHLRQTIPARVFLTAVAPAGTVIVRAREAARQIDHALSTGLLDRREPVHLIAHSMGGLDARHLLSNNLQGLTPHVATLVCIGTPHLGSPVATLVHDVNLLRPFLIAAAGRVHLLESLLQRTDAVADLSGTAAEAFNVQCPDVSTVRYLNIAGTGRRAGRRTSRFFLPSFLFLASRTRDQSDGVVPFQSATGRDAPFETWDADHGDLIGHDLDNLVAAPSAAHLARYGALVLRLS
jgi:triacylglycerol lipase